MIKRKSIFKKCMMVVTALSAMSLIVGCSSSGGGAGKNDGTLISIEDRYTPDKNTPAWKLDNREETVKLKWFVQADWWNTSFGEDYVTKKIKEDLNIDIEFVTGDDTILNTIFASGDMPDILTIFGADTAVARSAETWAFSLNELAETYDPYFLEAASADTLDWFQLENGNTYGYANYSNTFDDYANDTIPASTAFLIRQDVYDAIGNLPMGTPEEFEYALGKIKEEFPELAPLGFTAPSGTETGTMGDPLKNYLGVPLETETGAFHDRNLDEDYLTWIKTLNNIHKNGLISDDIFADDYTIFEEKVEAGLYSTIFVDGLTGISARLQNYKSNNPGKEYIAIDGPQSTVGNAPGLSQAGISGWMINYISKSTVDPAVAIQVFTYLLSDEGQMLVTFGQEGETFMYNDDGTVSLLPEIQDMRLNDTDKFKTDYRMGEFILFGHDRYNTLNKESFVEAIRQPQAWGRGKLKPQFIIENTDPEPGSQEARSLSAIKTEWSRTFVSLIRSKTDEEFNSFLDSYKSFLSSNNWDSIVEIKSENMEKNREKLGL